MTTPQLNVLRAMARIMILLGKGIGNPIIRGWIGDQRAEQIEIEIHIIKAEANKLDDQTDVASREFGAGHP